ncbi:MAG: hypothetical protein ACR2LX_16135 [Jatrophihabitans sp.]
MRVPLLAMAGGTSDFSPPDAPAPAPEDVGVELALEALLVFPPPPLLLAQPVSASETVATSDKAMPSGRMRDDKVNLQRIG